MPITKNDEVRALDRAEAARAWIDERGREAGRLADEIGARLSDVRSIRDTVRVTRILGQLRQIQAIASE